MEEGQNKNLTQQKCLQIQERTKLINLLPLPPIPIFQLPPPKISQHSYTLYYQKKHLMLINDSSSDQVNVKYIHKYNQSQKSSTQLSQQQKQLQQSNIKTINITLLQKCQRCHNWLLKSQMSTHKTFHAAIILQNKLYLGDKFSSQSRKQLIQRLGISHVVNAASQLLNHFQKDDQIVYIKLDLFDSMSEDVITPCQQAAEFIKTAILNNGKVFVHCAMGKSRSVAVILVYLMKYQGMSLPQSLNLVKSKRSLAKPNPSYLQQLEKFYQQKIRNKIQG